MYGEKVLLDWSEYQRLKSYEKKYIQLKKQTERTQANLSEQTGQGREQELERVILSQENENENVPKRQEILPPITTPQTITDIQGPMPKKLGEIGSGPSKDAPLNTEPENIEAMPKVPRQTKKRKKEKKDQGEPPGKWFFIGIPKYKH